MRVKYSLLKKYKWLGEFWVKGNEKNNFPGILSYSPKEGVRLKLLHREELQEECNLFGYTQETGPLTLLSIIPIGDLSTNFVTTEESFFCKTAILGGHFEFEELNFDDEEVETTEIKSKTPASSKTPGGKKVSVYLQSTVGPNQKHEKLIVAKSVLGFG